MNKKNLLKHALAAFLAVSLLVPFGAKASDGQDITGAKNYTITNPYETVDWNTWNHYKANLHTHSTASDGSVNFDKMIEAHYDRGYDILAMTDHAVVNKGWNIDPKIVPIISFQSYMNDPKPLTDERYAEIKAGAGRDGKGMTDVPCGVELNAISMKLTHVNGFFADYGQGLWGKENDYETPIAGVDKLGGLTVINHPGYWLGSGKDAGRAKDPKNIKFFGDILKKYDSCLGIEIAVENDGATRNDRIFWDCLLEKVIPTGRNVWGFANSDAHSIERIGVAFDDFMMPQNTVADVRTAMENGTFFSCALYAHNELGEDFSASGSLPSVTSIAVDDSTDQITVLGSNYTEIQWIANGEIIATGSAIDLNEYESHIGSYVRAQLIGPGGICFTQAFVTDDGSVPPVDPEITGFAKIWNDFVFAMKSTRLYVLFELLFRGF